MKNATKEAQPNAEAAFPLFYSSPQVITLELHKDASLRSDITLSFAADTNSIPLTMADLPEAAKYYPIAFTQTKPTVPVAIVGLEQKNYYVDAQGKWLQGCYVPSYVRRYPFVFVENPQSDELTLCVDGPALGTKANEAARFYENEQPTAFINNALEFCAAYQEQHRYTLALCEALEKKGMLAEKRSDIELASGKTLQLNGFQLIEPDKFRNLSESEIVDWCSRGYLASVYYILQSQTNWSNLLELANKQSGANGKA